MGSIVRLRGLHLGILQLDLADRDVRELTVCIDGGFKYKVNERSWSPPVGELIESAGSQMSAEQILDKIREHRRQALRMAEHLKGGPDENQIDGWIGRANELRDLLADIPGTPERKELIEQAARRGEDI